MLKLIIFFSLIIPLATVAQKNTKSFEINGTIDSLEDGTKIYLNYWVNAENTDTAIIRNGRFHFIGKVSCPNPAVINFGEQNPKAKFFWLENIKISFTGFGKNLDKGVIKSSANNKELEDYKHTTDTLEGNDSLVNAFNVSYIKNHPDSYLSGVALLMIMGRLQPDIVKSLYQGLSLKIKKSFYGKEFEKFMGAEKQTKDKAQPLPNLFADSIKRNGITLNLKETDNYFTAADKRNFIDSFFEEYPALIKQYNSNSSKIIGFTFDKSNGITAEYKIDDITVSKNWKPSPNEPGINITQMLTEIVLNKDVPSWVTKTNTKNFPANKPDTISRNGLTVYFEDADKSFTDAYKKRFADTYFEQYPKLVSRYNTHSPKAVTFSIDKSYNGIAVTINDIIIFNPAWFTTNPEDIDVITHELMHVVQGYDYNHVPSWVTEGIADYARATQGINNEKANWSMPDYDTTQHYDNSYRITARFFVWITQNYKADFCKSA